MMRAFCVMSARGPIRSVAWLFLLMAGWLWVSLAMAQSPGTNKAPRRVQRARAATDPAAKTSGSNSPSSTGPAADAKPAIVAVVNGQSISRQELAAQCLKRYGETVLESLVNKHLILEACRQKNIHITHQDIEEEITRIAGRFSLPKDRWLQMLEQERNISPEQYRRDIIWPTLALKQLASDQLNVSDEELQKEFESEYGPKVQVRMIATSDAAKAQQLLAQAKAKPDDFGILAKNHSEDPNSAAARGLIPPVRRHIGDPTVEKVCFGLKPGEISPVVSVAGQQLIFKCEKHLPAAHISPQYRQAAYDRLKDRIIDRNLRLASAKIFQELQSSAKVVNVLNDAALRKQQPSVAATINNQQITIAQLAEECIARHGVDVLDAEINFMLLQQALKSKQLSVSGAEVDAEVARAAEAYGFLTSDKKPDVPRWLKEVSDREGMDAEVYVRDAVWPSVALKKLVEGGVEVTEDDLSKGFEANYGPRVEVLAIVLGNQRTAQEVWDLARSNLTPTFFGELAAQYSIEPVSRANMGEVPPIRRYSGQPQVEEEAFSLTKEDPLSAIIAVADKYIIMYYLGRTEPVVTKIEEVSDELNKDIHEKKLRLAMSQEFDRLKEVAQIDNFLAGRSQAGGKPQSDPASPPEARPARSSPQLVRPASRRTATSR
jgi:parvulin-like peptidyl-prolyl isomerase